MIFDSWSDIARIVVAAVAAYALLVAVLRLSGKRTLAKLNAFDLVVTVALGSTLATVVLSSDVALAEGGLALALLVVLQFVVAWTATRSALVRRFTKSEPTVVLRDGRLLEQRMRTQRVTPQEVCQAIRSSGSGGLEDVAAVVLETDGTFSVISRQNLGSGSALADLDGVPVDPRTGQVGDTHRH